MYLFKRLDSDEEFEAFWPELMAYMTEDLFAEDKTDLDYFLGEEYKAAMKALHKRASDTLAVEHILFEGEKIGFILYVIYDSEDGRCYVMEYRIDKPYRGQGHGRRAFEAFRESGAGHFALTATNEDNLRFWKSLGFVFHETNEHEQDVYILR